MKNHKGFFEKAIKKYDVEDKLKGSIAHNYGFFSTIHGAYALADEYFFDFDPVMDYWRMPERLILVSFFSSFWYQRYFPAEALRKLAFSTFLHFERARQDGKLGERYSNFEFFKGDEWRNIIHLFINLLETLPEISDFSELNAIRSNKLIGSSHKDNLANYAKDILDRAEELWKLPYKNRLAFFPYLGLTNLDDLEKRQTFFMSFYTLFTSTNSYHVGGAQTFAPILQNNSTRHLFDFVKKWASGESLDGMDIFVDNSNSEKINCNLYMPIVELYSFINLKSHPIYNKAAKLYTTAFDSKISDNKSGILKLMTEIGGHARAFLNSNPTLIDKFTKVFDDLTKEKPLAGFKLVEMEGVRIKKLLRSSPDEAEKQVDNQILSKIKDRMNFDDLSSLERASVIFNLILDAYVYYDYKSPSIGDPDPKSETKLKLPESLQRFGNDALGYLRAGFNILFAGAPGTGKTTLAQFVGHAWNNDLPELQLEIPLSSAPFTTVANSAWAPFHTIGGVLPDGEGHFSAQRGVFMEPSDETDETWQMRNEAIILDEMNRADLDRCIGELYPLLSDNVREVTPAGIPGVKYISKPDKFRLIATVNDSTLDDVVFPISEGLARRFQRIELYGGTDEQIMEFLKEGLPDGRMDYLKTAEEIVSLLFNICDENDYLTSFEDDSYLPFGVGYFGLLKSWLRGELSMSSSFDEQSQINQAKQILKASMAGAIRIKGQDKIFDEFFSEPDTA